MVFLNPVRSDNLTKEQLKRYRALKFELADVNADIRNSTIHDSAKGSQKDFPWTLGTKHIEGVTDEDYDLLVRKSDLKAQIKEIEDFVNGIEDNVLHRSITYKYINIEKDRNGKVKPPLKWFQVAQKVNCGLSGDGIRMKVDRFLKNI